MDPDSLRTLLESVRQGQTSTDDALERLRLLPYEDLGFATLDHHRALRHGFPEVVFCLNKTPEQSATIVERLAARSDAVLATRATPDTFAAVRERVPSARYHELARAITVERPGEGARPRRPGVTVVCAGTSDLPVAEEAAVTAEIMGHEVDRIVDVGVAGLLSVPVIAVPTSVGYGASFGGIAALLGMLNSCSSGIAVVNIDNGFGAGTMAAMINRGPESEPAPDTTR